MNTSPEILLVDDHAGDVRWLTEFLEERGYAIHHIANEEAARRQLRAVKNLQALYVMAIIDVMVASKDIMDLIGSKETFYEQSKDTGIRLCRYAREELEISAETLPIVCLSARDDDDVKRALEALRIPLYSRTAQIDEDSIREYLRKKLPKIK